LSFSASFFPLFSAHLGIFFTPFYPAGSLRDLKYRSFFVPFPLSSEATVSINNSFGPKPLLFGHDILYFLSSLCPRLVMCWSLCFFAPSFFPLLRTLPPPSLYPARAAPSFLSFTFTWAFCFSQLLAVSSFFGLFFPCVPLFSPPFLATVPPSFPPDRFPTVFRHSRHLPQRLCNYRDAFVTDPISFPL